MLREDAAGQIAAHAHLAESQQLLIARQLGQLLPQPRKRRWIAPDRAYCQLLRLAHVQEHLILTGRQHVGNVAGVTSPRRTLAATNPA